jgi:hypothetical protein
MTTQTSSASLPFDGPATVRCWQRTTRSITHRYLDLYSSAVGRFADAEVESTRAANVPALLPLALSHAALHRDVADAYVTAIRGFLDAG